MKKFLFFFLITILALIITFLDYLLSVPSQSLNRLLIFFTTLIGVIIYTKIYENYSKTYKTPTEKLFDLLADVKIVKTWEDLKDFLKAKGNEIFQNMYYRFYYRENPEEHFKLLDMNTKSDIAGTLKVQPEILEILEKDKTELLTKKHKKNKPLINFLKKHQVDILIKIFYGEVLYGIIFLSVGRKGLEAEDINNAKIIQKIFSLAISNIFTYKEQEQYKQIYSDLMIATRIQEIIMPKANEDIEERNIEISLYHAPSMLLGGDYVNVMDLGRGRKGIIIWDVAGKGVSASLISAIMHSFLMFVEKSARSPHIVLKKLNEFLTFSMPSQELITFATSFYGILDLKKLTLTYSSAGHPPPILFSPTQKKVTELKTKAKPLGILAKEHFPVEKVELQKGDVLLVYTDGLTDVYNDKQEQLGSKRIKNFLRRFIFSNKNITTKELKTILLEYVNRFTKGKKENIPDDLTFIIIKVK